MKSRATHTVDQSQQFSWFCMTLEHINIVTALSHFPEGHVCLGTCLMFIYMDSSNVLKMGDVEETKLKAVYWQRSPKQQHYKKEN